MNGSTTYSQSSEPLLIGYQGQNVLGIGADGQNGVGQRSLLLCPGIPCARVNNSCTQGKGQPSQLLGGLFCSTLLPMHNLN